MRTLLKTLIIFIFVVACYAQKEINPSYEISLEEIALLRGGWATEHSDEFLEKFMSYSWGPGNGVKWYGVDLLIDYEETKLFIEVPGLAKFPITNIAKVDNSTYSITILRANQVSEKGGWKEKGVLVLKFIEKNKIAMDISDYHLFNCESIELYKIAGPDIKY